MRAFLFARATAAMWGWERAVRRPNQLCAARAELRFICRSTDCAPRMSSVRRYRSPRLLIPRRRVFPPEESWRGTSPNQAASCRPFLKVRIADACQERTCTKRTNAWDLIQAAAQEVLAMPRKNLLLPLAHRGAQLTQLAEELTEALTQSV